MKNLKKILAMIVVTATAVSMIPVAWADFDSEIKSYPWAEKSARYCFNNGLLSGDEYGEFDLGGNITRAQMARIFTDAFGLEKARRTAFADSKKTDWYYPYSLCIQNYMPVRGENFNGGEFVTREEFAATLVKASGQNGADSFSVTNYSFHDAAETDDDYKNLIETAVKDLYLLGDENDNLRPKALLTRAEACCILFRALCPGEDKHPILAGSQVSLQSAINWAKQCGASEMFIKAAPLYWHYGHEFGIRPDMMYAQAAKETAYGNYGGAVLPEMNNFAGIKIKEPTGDKTEDHETFATPEDGIRAHFNHMCAYVGLAPLGEVHDRYYVVKSIDWAGSIKYVEQLGGRWCPDINYGYDILKMIDTMKKY